MPEYLAPAVYVEETSFRAKSIEGVGTSTAAFVGLTARGPISAGAGGVTPPLLTSVADYERYYGGVRQPRDRRRGHAQLPRACGVRILRQWRRPALRRAHPRSGRAACGKRPGECRCAARTAARRRGCDRDPRALRGRREHAGAAGHEFHRPPGERVAGHQQASRSASARRHDGAAGQRFLRHGWAGSSSARDHRGEPDRLGRAGR